MSSLHRALIRKQPQQAGSQADVVLPLGVLRLFHSHGEIPLKGRENPLGEGAQAAQRVPIPGVWWVPCHVGGQDYSWLPALMG